MRFNRKMLVLLMVALVAVAASAYATTQAAVSRQQIDLTFVNHLAAEMPEQDVFVETEPGSDQVRRITVDEAQAFMDTLVYGSIARIEHDPFQLGTGPLGPYPKGEALGFTMGEWLAGTGSGTYTVDGDQAEIEVQFENLVPNGVYTLWCAHINAPPNFTIVDEPCGAQDGSQNTIVADEQGQATFNLTLDKLPDTNEETTRAIAAAYHSDGQTYGFYPGRFGYDSHVQTLAFIPAPDDTAWQALDDGRQQIDLTFVNHLAAEMPEQDVFVETEPGSDQVRRITVDEAESYLDAPVFASITRIEHDPFQLGTGPLGPYPKGEALGFTMGEWLAGAGSGTYTVDGEQAEIEVQFENLVPNGVYTLWCAHINAPPNFTIVDEPCGAQDGSQNTIVADEQGQATFNLMLDKLPDTNEETTRAIAAAYHSDSQTYGFYPGRFGHDTHVQILAFIPAPDDPAWQTISEGQ